MCASHELVRLDDFLNSTQAITESGGLPLHLASILTKPLWWAMEQLGISSDDSSRTVSYEQRWKIARGSYVHLPALEVSSSPELKCIWYMDGHLFTLPYFFPIIVMILKKAADIVVARQRDALGSQLSNSVYDLVSFRTQFGHLVFPSSAQPATNLDVKVLLRYLDRDRKVVVHTNEVRFSFSSFEINLSSVGSLNCNLCALLPTRVSYVQVIKFAAPGEAHGVTELDRNFVELTAAERALAKQVDELSSSIEE